MISLVRWALHCRALSVLTLACVIGGCDSPDRLTSTSENPSTPGVAELAPVEAPSLASSFRGGIPFGTWALPTEHFGEVFNGAMRNIYPEQLLKELAAIKARGGKVILAMAGKEDNFKDRNGHFSLSMWKARVDRFRNVHFSGYLDDGTIIGHYMIDEPNDPVNWTGIPVDGPMLEQMATYSKQLWPKMATIVRTTPTYLTRWPGAYRNLDVAWAQWTMMRGEASSYITREVANARRLGLALVMGLNIRKGGLNKTNMPASVVRSAGAVLLAEEYPCAFISWEYDEAYLKRDDVREAMELLSNRAEDRPTKSCARGGGGGGPPDDDGEENEPPTAGFGAPSCTAGMSCQFSDGSSDADGEIASWGWEFGDGGSSTDRNPTHTFATAGTYTVTLRVTDDDGASRSITSAVTVSPRPNQLPTAAFTAPSCTANEPCQFSDASTDSDGSVTGRSWSFEGGGTATGANPVYAFTSAGIYSVTLTITDDGGGNSSVTRSVTVTAQPVAGRDPIALSSAVVVRRGTQRIMLTWTGAAGATLELYRNEVQRERIKNDGLYLRTRGGLRAGTYTYRLCEQGTSNCSNTSSVTLP